MIFRLQSRRPEKPKCGRKVSLEDFKDRRRRRWHFGARIRGILEKDFYHAGSLKPGRNWEDEGGLKTLPEGQQKREKWPECSLLFPLQSSGRMQRWHISVQRPSVFFVNPQIMDSGGSRSGIGINVGHLFSNEKASLHVGNL